MVAEFTLRGLLVSAIAPSKYKMSLFQRIPWLRLWLVYIINKKFSQPLLITEMRPRLYWKPSSCSNMISVTHKLHKWFLKTKTAAARSALSGTDVCMPGADAIMTVVNKHCCTAKLTQGEGANISPTMVFTDSSLPQDLTPHSLHIFSYVFVLVKRQPALAGGVSPSAFLPSTAGWRDFGWPDRKFILSLLFVKHTCCLTRDVLSNWAYQVWFDIPTKLKPNKTKNTQNMWPLPVV